MQEAQAIATLREAGVLAAWVFGSRASGAARADSDIDMALLTDEPLPLLRRERLARDLSALLGAEVDLVDLRRAGLALQARVVRTGRLLFSDDEPARVAEVVRIQGRWPDVQRSLAAMDEAFLAKVAGGGLGDG